jgi:hypothetical protein
MWYPPKKGLEFTAVCCYPWKGMLKIQSLHWHSAKSTYFSTFYFMYTDATQQILGFFQIDITSSSTYILIYFNFPGFPNI